MGVAHIFSSLKPILVSQLGYLMRLFRVWAVEGVGAPMSVQVEHFVVVPRGAGVYKVPDPPPPRMCYLYIISKSFSELILILRCVKPSEKDGADLSFSHILLGGLVQIHLAPFSGLQIGPKNAFLMVSHRVLHQVS